MTVTVRECILAVAVVATVILFMAWRFHVTDPANWPTPAPQEATR